MPSIGSIFTSPVKSLALNQVESVSVGNSGIVEDRRFYLVDAEGRLVTQRQHGRLALVRAGYSAESDELTLQFPDGRLINGPTELGDEISAKVHWREVAGREVTGPWNEALSSYCGSTMRLVKTGNPGECFDEYPVSVLSQASLDHLSSRINGGPQFEGRRFRPNFLLDGCSPHEEDSWLGGVVRIGPDLRVKMVAPDPRCAITTLDPETGERDFDVPRLILSYRPSDRSPYFGVYGTVETTGTVSVGDAVELV